MTSTRWIDLNSDLGEGYGPFHVGHDVDADLFPLISSANVACGFHGGDPRTIARTVERATAHGVAIGAHPSFPDLVGFGRRTIAASLAEIEADVLYQLGAVSAFCTAVKTPLRHVKAHGALYNIAVKDRPVADAIAAAVAKFDSGLDFFALPGSELEAAGLAAGLPVVREAFADRAYNADGSLVSRSLPGSVLTDPEVVAERMVRFVETGEIETIDGQILQLAAETICIHSDTPTAVPIARALRARFDTAGIGVRAHVAGV
ncbi:MAG TPA: 5-oxoprolinase subunit PxpA [Thermomicrobiales bacterium]|nr:5-oxoprolinase subunit PxpA [Thermomicrobiales bacterium]